MVIVSGLQEDVIGRILNASEFPSCLEWYIYICAENSTLVGALNLTYSGNITEYNNNNNNKYKAEIINIAEYLNTNYKEDQFVNIVKNH